jgi:hypothetical protein
VARSKTHVHNLLQYHVVTLSLNIPRFLGLNMIEPHKPLIDSGLAVFLFADSNKNAPKVMKNAPILGRGKVKIKLLM